MFGWSSTPKVQEVEPKPVAAVTQEQLQALTQDILSLREEIAKLRSMLADKQTNGKKQTMWG